MLRRDLHTFPSKIKIFHLVTSWTDNKIFCPINCSFHCYFSKEVLKFYMYRNRKAKCVPLLLTSQEDTCMRSVCKMHIKCSVVCNMFLNLVLMSINSSIESYYDSLNAILYYWSYLLVPLYPVHKIPLVLPEIKYIVVH